MLLKYWYNDISNVTWVSYNGTAVSWPGLVYKKEIHERFDQIVIEILKDEEGRTYFLDAARNDGGTGESIEHSTVSSDIPQEQVDIPRIQPVPEPPIPTTIRKA